MNEIHKRRWLISQLRRITRKWPGRIEAEKKCKHSRRVSKRTGRLGWHFKCRKCRKLFPMSERRMDHIKPVVDPKKGDEGIAVWIERCFVEEKGWQALCNSCHKKKTDREKAVRKRNGF